MRIFFTFVLLIAQHAFAFDFKHLSGGMPIAEVKKHYPEANFEIISTSLPHRTHQYFSVKNTRHDGEVIFIFVNGYLTNHAVISEFEQKLLVAPTAEHPALIKSINAFKRHASRPFHEQLLLSSFIWKPSKSIPTRKVIARLGETGEGRTDSANRITFLRWEKKGIDAYFAPGAGRISYIEFWFSYPLAYTINDQLIR